MNQPPPHGQSRFNELLEALKQEHEAVSQDIGVFRMQREDFEHKGKSMWIMNMKYSQKHSWL